VAAGRTTRKQGRFACGVSENGVPPWRMVSLDRRCRQAEGVRRRPSHAVLMAGREHSGRAASPTTGRSERFGRHGRSKGRSRSDDPCGQSARRKRHIQTDTDIDTGGHLDTVAPHAGTMQDPDRAKPVSRASRSLWAFVRTVFTAGGRAGGRVAWPTRSADLTPRPATPHAAAAPDG